MSAQISPAFYDNGPMAGPEEHSLVREKIVCGESKCSQFHQSRYKLEAPLNERC